MVSRAECPGCRSSSGRYVQMFRAYIRKYDPNGKARWIPKGWLCEKCNTFVPDEKEKG